jgi:hypothetical protein
MKEKANTSPDFNRIHVEEALTKELIEEMRLQTYVEIQRLSENPANTAFQDLFTQYYYVSVRPAEWRKHYFSLFESCCDAVLCAEGNLVIDSAIEVLKTLLRSFPAITRKRQKGGDTYKAQLVDLSFASKMMATMCPKLIPMWDSNVELVMTANKFIPLNTGNDITKNHDSGKTIDPFENAIEAKCENFKQLLLFYESLKNADKVEEYARAFDESVSKIDNVSDCIGDITDCKKVDFILWTLGKEMKKKRQEGKL